MLICGLISLLFLSVNSQSVRLLSSTELLSEVNKQNDTLYVLNFWATWCKPCIEELPWFETAGKNYKDNTVKILLINLDFNSKVNNQVIPFVRKKN
ncbi:MAG: TlpA family protein disulfide reductase [Bacteroidetes bacterium]|nr:TlpA family protein disulfide reductase [Bacteroidota bacterium]